MAKLTAKVRAQGPLSDQGEPRRKEKKVSPVARESKKAPSRCASPSRRPALARASFSGRQVVAGSSRAEGSGPVEAEE